MTLRLLQNRGEDVAGVRFVALSALDVENRGLQHAAEGERLLGLLVDAAAQPFDRRIEVRAERSPQSVHVGAARLEDPFAVGVVRERVQQVLERQIRVTPRDRLAKRNIQDDFQCR